MALRDSLLLYGRMDGLVKMTNEGIQVSEVVHGGIDFAEMVALGLNPDEVIDFSSNILPDGPSPMVYEAIQKSRIDRYPDRQCTELVDTISRVYGVEASRLLVGNGCCELIHLVASTFLKTDDQVLVIGPTFSEYERVSKLSGCKIVEVRCKWEEQFAVSDSRIGKALEQNKPKMVWLCNPNNPTGRSISSGQILSWLAMYPSTLFVIDESYIEFTESVPTIVREHHPNLIVLRSLTKLHALAGLRLGFAVAPADLTKEMRMRRIAWSVNTLAQAAGVAALLDDAYYRSALSRLHVAKHSMVSRLRGIGFMPIPSDTCFFLLQVPESNAVRQRILKSGLLVRSCDSFGMSGYIRVSVRTEFENARLVDALIAYGCKS